MWHHSITASPTLYTKAPPSLAARRGLAVTIANTNTGGYCNRYACAYANGNPHTMQSSDSMHASISVC